MTLPPFHLAFPVRDIEETRRFYVDLLGCGQGRETKDWLDLDFFGHQIVAHKRDNIKNPVETGEVDGDDVPVPHFGAVLEWNQWHTLADTLKQAGIDFVIPPRTRFKGQPGEQGTFFMYDPSGNALEFKTFKDPQKLFAPQ